MIRSSGTGREGRKKNKKKLVPRLEKKKQNCISHKFKNYLGDVTEWLQVAARGEDTRCGAPLSQEPVLWDSWKPQFSGIPWALKMGISVRARVD